MFTDLFSFVEFETAADLKTAVERLDGREFKGARVTCTPDVSLPLSISLTLKTHHRSIDSRRASTRTVRTFSIPRSSPWIPSGWGGL